jgi:hypothetical protein
MKLNIRYHLLIIYDTQLVLPLKQNMYGLHKYYMALLGPPVSDIWYPKWYHLGDALAAINKDIHQLLFILMRNSNMDHFFKWSMVDKWSITLYRIRIS